MSDEPQFNQDFADEISRLTWRDVLIIDTHLRTQGLHAGPKLREVLFQCICNDGTLPDSDLAEALLVFILNERIGCSEPIWELSAINFDWLEPDSFILWNCASLGLLHNPPDGIVERLVCRANTSLFFGERVHATIDLLAALAVRSVISDATILQPKTLIARFAFQATRYLQQSLAVMPDPEVKWYVDQLEQGRPGDENK